MTASDTMPVLETRDLKAWFGDTLSLKGIEMKVPARSVTSIIGPSGCGKSTFLRCLNRLHEETPNARVSGEVLLYGENVYGNGKDPVPIRRRVGMVFQRPNPFPSLSIYENVAAGLKLGGVSRKSLLTEVVEKGLKRAALWDEVKDKLSHPATRLSGGQQQRLCIARALAVQPEVLLMDEPTSALDPISTGKIEELVRELKSQVTILIVTHNMQQAARVSDSTAFFLLGELIEFNTTKTLFTNPKEDRTERYITGKFG